MIKVTEADWDKIKRYINEELANKIEQDNYLATLKLPKVEVKINIINSDGKEELREVTGEKLADNWAITPIIERDGSLHKIRRTLTYLPTGHRAVEIKNRKEVLRLWEEVKNLDIHHDKLVNLQNSKDYSKFADICKRYSY